MSWRLLHAALSFAYSGRVTSKHWYQRCTDNPFYSTAGRCFFQINFCCTGGRYINCWPLPSIWLETMHVGISLSVEIAFLTVYVVTTQRYQAIHRFPAWKSWLYIENKLQYLRLFWMFKKPVAVSRTKCSPFMLWPTLWKRKRLRCGNRYIFEGALCPCVTLARSLLLRGLVRN